MALGEPSRVPKFPSAVDAAGADPGTPAEEQGHPTRGWTFPDLFVLAVVSILPLIVAARMLLPERYSYDSGAIRRVAQRQYAPVEDTSYLHVGRMYEWLGMAERPWAASLLGAVLALAALYAALVSARGRPTLPAVFLVGLYALTSAVYLGQYSKDVWVLLVVLVVLTARPGLVGELSIVGATALYAYSLRSYWALILLVYVGLRVLTARGLRPRTVVIAVVCVIAGVTLTAPAVLGQSIQAFREGVNLDRVLSADATTAISAPQVGGGVFGEVVENLVLFAELVVPVPLALIGSPQHALFAVAIAGLWIVFGRALFVGSSRFFDGRPARAKDVRTVRAALFSIAVLTTQCLFEPDYGSYLRHLTAVLPLLIAATVGAARQPRGEAPVEPVDTAPEQDALPPPMGGAVR